MNFAIFYGIFTVFYTTFFTNGFGFFTGIVGSLGYWLEQQGVHRGEQPFYYYILIQMPIYEFLAMFGTLLAVYFGIRYNRLSSFSGERLSENSENYDQTTSIEVEETPQYIDGVDGQPPSPVFLQERPLPTLALFLFWALTSLVAYSIAGEKMPWLTVHIAVPFLISAAWGFGYLIETTPWQKLKGHHAWLALILVPVALTSLGGRAGHITQPSAAVSGQHPRSTPIHFHIRIFLAGFWAFHLGNFTIFTGLASLCHPAPVCGWNGGLSGGDDCQNRLYSQLHQL